MSLRKRVLQRPWAQPGYFPTLSEIRWARLDEWREQHEAAVADLQTAKGDAAAEVETLCAVIEQAIPDLRRRMGLTWGTMALPEGEGLEAEAAYAAAKAEVERHDLSRVPLGELGIREWAEKAEERGEARLVEPAWQRLRVREDWEALRGFRATVLDGATRLVAGRIVPMAVSEAEVARAELQAAKSGAAA